MERDYNFFVQHADKNINPNNTTGLNRSVTFDLTCNAVGRKGVDRVDLLVAGSEDNKAMTIVNERFILVDAKVSSKYFYTQKSNPSGKPEILKSPCHVHQHEQRSYRGHQEAPSKFETSDDSEAIKSRKFVSMI